jgi:leader peptidase (prepilin peptidase)/N-methyltransferase
LLGIVNIFSVGLIMQTIIYSLSFLFGSAIGSFINVLVYRWRPEQTPEPVDGRSYCDSCRRTLRWYELVPVFSFIFLRGKCRVCREKIPRQYFAVELITGIIFSFLVWRLSRLNLFIYGSTDWWWGIGLIGLWWLIAGVMVAISAYDAAYYLIPDIFLYVLIGLGAVLNGYYFLLTRFDSMVPKSGIVFSGAFGYFMGRQEFSVFSGLWGVLFCLLVVGLAYVLSRGQAMGFGDVLLGIGLGLILGWPDALLGMLFGFVLGTVVSLGLIISKRKTLKDIVPFGPFLVAGALLAVLFSDTIVREYFSLFSRIFNL